MMRLRQRWPLAVLMTAISFSLPQPARAQSATIAVVDAAGVPIPFAVITVDKASARVADDSGRLIIPSVEADSLRLHVRRIGYREFYGTLARSADDRYVVTMNPLASTLAAVTVRERANTPLARRGFYGRMERVQRGAIVGYFLTPEDLDDFNESTVSGMLRRSSYVRIARTRPARGAPKTLVLGRGGCGMNIVIDGQLAHGTAQEQAGGEAPTSINGRGTASGGGGGEAPDIDQLLDGRSVAAIEVYPSGANAPAEVIPMTGRGSCGIVVIWTGGRQ